MAFAAAAQERKEGKMSQDEVNEVIKYSKTGVYIPHQTIETIRVWIRFSEVLSDPIPVITTLHIRTIVF